MYYVYVIRSISYPDQEYTGITENLKQRIKDHKPANLFTPPNTNHGS